MIRGRWSEVKVTGQKSRVTGQSKGHWSVVKSQRSLVKGQCQGSVVKGQDQRSLLDVRVTSQR